MDALVRTEPVAPVCEVHDRAASPVRGELSDRAPVTVVPRAPVHIPALDGVRGLAILAVLATHAYRAALDAGAGPPVGLGPRLFETAVWAGWLGVDLFFVLSGFLITGILVDSRDDAHFFRNFYARRALRIFPLYYAVVAFRLFVLPLISLLPLHDVGAGEAASYWLYAANLWQSFWAPPGQGFDGVLGVCWSLAVEEQFYLVWPLVVWCCPRRRLTGLCLLMIAAAPAVRCGLWLAGASEWSAYTLMPCRMDALAAGALLALLARRDGLSAWRGTARTCAMLGLVGLAAVIWCQRNPSNIEWPMALAGYSASAVLFASLLTLTLVSERGLPARLCRSRFLRMFGKYSYAVYLFHFPIFLALPRLWWHWPSGAPLLRWLVEAGGIPACTIIFGTAGTLIALGLAWLSWQLFERHWLGLKRYFEPGQAKVRVVRVPTQRAA